MMMMKQLLFFSFTLLLLFLFHCATILAQSPAQAPAAAAPTISLAPVQPKAPGGKLDVTKILKTAGRFSLFVRLLKSTQVGDQINRQLKGSHQRLTLFAPNDGAFSNLQSGTLNSLTDGQQVQLLLFHVLPTFLSTSQFQTVSNPLRTEAGDTGEYDFPLNITTNAANQANVSTGVVNATLDQTLYSDNQLAIYEVDKVLLPMNIFGGKAPAPSPSPVPVPAPAPKKAKTLALAPAPVLPNSKPKTKSPASTASSSSSSSSDDSQDTSAAVGLGRHGIMVFVGSAVIAAFFM